MCGSQSVLSGFNLIGTIMSTVFTGSERTSYYAWFMSLALLISIVIAWRPQSSLRVSKQTS